MATHRRSTGNSGRGPATEPSPVTDAGGPATGLPRFAERFQERFAWGTLLGKGGMGRVLSAADSRLRREVALKILNPTPHPDAGIRFLDEAQITAQLQHPNIIPIYDIIDGADGQPIIAMKPIAGDTLATVIRRAHQKPGAAGMGGEWRRLLEIFSKVCDAVAFAHHHGIIHRDLKPHNIMVGEFGDVVVMDWGLAKPIGYTPPETSTPSARHSGRTNAGRQSGRSVRSEIGPVVTSDRRELGLAVTMTGAVQGTPAYMPPEQALGGRSLDEGADIFALGGILYTLLTNHLPVDGDTVGDELSAVIEHQIIPPRQRAPHAKIPAELEAVVLRAMARRRRDRFATVKDLQAEIERFWDGHLLESASYSPLQRIAKWVRRHPTVTMSATVSVVFVAVLGVVVSAWFAQAERTVAAELVAKAEAARAAEAEARHRDAETVAHERQRLLDAMNAGNFSHVLELLSGQVHTGRDAAIEEFAAHHRAARASGLSDERFIAELGQKRVRDYLAAFDRLIEAHEKWGVAVTGQDFFSRGMLRAIGQNDDIGAIRDYDRAIKLDPHHARAFGGRAISASRLGERTGAMRDFDEAIRLDPAIAEVHYGRGVVQVMQGKIDAGIRDYDRAIEINPRFVEALNNRGYAKFQLGAIDEALIDLDRAIAIFPESAAAHTNRGLAKNARGDRAGAIADYSRAIELDPGMARAFSNRGNTKVQLGEYASAIDDFDEAIRLDPNSVGAFTNRGIAKKEMNDLDGALADFNRAIELDPETAQAYNNRGAIRRERGDVAGALADYDRAIEYAPNADSRVATHYNRGILKQAHGDHRGAIADFDAVISHNPQFWQALVNRGQLRIRHQIDAAGGIHDVQQAYRLCPDPAMRTQMADFLRYYRADIPE